MDKPHQEVQMWLEKIFGDRNVPAYELNKFTVETLTDLMQRNVRQEKNTQLLIEDYRQKAEEYGAENRRLEGILDSLGMTSGSLSQSGVMSLRTLANLALTLNTADATDTRLLLALGWLEEETGRVGEARRTQQRLLQQLTHDIQAARIKHSTLSKALEDLESKASAEQCEVEKQAQNTLFMRNKAKEYKSHTQKMEVMLEKTRVDPSIYHQTLTQRAQELDRLKQQIVPLRKQLESYHGLPPDAIQAHVRLEELKETVSTLEEEVRRKIDVMQI
ncbi:HAUS augmin-like complex subunit 1 isoform X2 [Dreissena polymorpha]|uniref:HAUS augmin-like complex subunit 1 isoform X2 n=1 Tax=Dreissena polymorpha TaxID=45954 RepID=UPI0022652915|nr:HAUS augmin-like complex subunit 1 isoform X2 [Dreissena polymorpha]